MQTVSWIKQVSHVVNYNKQADRHSDTQRKRMKYWAEKIKANWYLAPIFKTMKEKKKITKYILNYLPKINTGILFIKVVSFLAFKTWYHFIHFIIMYSQNWQSFTLRYSYFYPASNLQTKMAIKKRTHSLTNLFLWLEMPRINQFVIINFHI